MLHSTIARAKYPDDRFIGMPHNTVSSLGDAYCSSERRHFSSIINVPVWLASALPICRCPLPFASSRRFYASEHIFKAPLPSMGKCVALQTRPTNKLPRVHARRRCHRALAYAVRDMVTLHCLTAHREIVTTSLQTVPRAAHK